MASTLKETLERLRSASDPVLRDLAAALLSGRLNLSDITTTTEALPVLQRALDDYAQWRTSLSDEEFAALTGEAHKHIGELRRRIAADGEGHA